MSETTSLPRPTRRTLLLTGAALPFALSPGMAQAEATPTWVLLGTDKGRGIFRARWDARTGVLGTPELALESVRPSFVADHPGHVPVMYVANEGSGAQATISAVRYDAATGAVRLLNAVPAHGDGTCYVAASAEFGMAFCANYSGGTFAANRIGADGSLTTGADASQAFVPPPLPNPGPVPDRQDKPHLHCSVVDDGHCLVCDLAGDRIFAFPLLRPRGKGHVKERNEEQDATLFGEPHVTPARAGSGPRHITFFQNVGDRRLYLVIHELDCTVETFERVAGGPLRPVNGTVVSTLPEGVNRTGSTGSEIVVAPGARFVYTATRTANLLTVFAVEGTRLRAVQSLPCGGDQPRWIGLDPSGRWLMCCNQAGNSVTVFARDETTGRLTAAGPPLKADSPMCAQWLVTK